jgi:hypothetical protein
MVSQGEFLSNSGELAVGKRSSLARHNALEFESDNSDSLLYKHESSNGLSWEKVQKDIDNGHPRKWTYGTRGKYV